MTTDETLEKSNVVLDMIDKFEDKNPDGSFKEFLQEILHEWRKLK